MAQVKVFQKKVKLQGRGHKVNNFCTDRNALSQGIHVKYESPISSGSKVMAQVKYILLHALTHPTTNERPYYYIPSNTVARE